MTKNQIFILASIAIVVIGYFMFIKKKKTTENSWVPEFRDVNKEMRAMTGMFNEGNSVVGMIGNKKYGAMTHESNFIGEQVGEYKPIKKFGKS
jgi:hypothetical protein